MRRTRYHTRLPPRIQGFDTEARRGDLLVVCSPQKHHEFRNDKNAPERLLAWLWREARDTNFFYNLVYDRDVLFKPFASRMGKKARSVRSGPYSIKLLGNKSFSLRKKGAHRVKSFYDISGFFADGDHTLPLEEVARLFLGKGKLPDVDRERLGEEDGYYESHRAKVIEYCRRDAELARDLGKLLAQTLKETLGFYPSRFNSKASISKAWAEATHPELFSHHAGYRWSLDRASYRGGIFLTRVLGRVENVTEVDISSAYGDALAKLPRLDRLTRRTSNEYHPEARLGAYWILTPYDGRLPLDPRLRHKRRGQVRVIYPDSHGKLKPYTASKVEMDYFARTGRKFVVLMAEEFFGPFEPQFPELVPILEKITWLKGPAKTDPRAKIARMLYKTIVNALYGCLAESRHGETDLTTWILAAEITGRTRTMIWSTWDLLEECGSLIVSVNTDSIRYVGANNIDAYYGTTPYPSVGGFERKFYRAIVTHYQSGIAVIEEPGKKPMLRKRGKPLLTVDLLHEAKGSVLAVPTHRPTHLFEAIARDDPESIGVFSDPNDDNDDTKLDLKSNLFALDFPLADLRFETLNARPVHGFAPDFDDVTRDRWEPAHIKERRDLKAELSARNRMEREEERDEDRRHRRSYHTRLRVPSWTRTLVMSE